MIKTIYTWRKATDEELEKGLDDPTNKGMILVDTQEIEVPDEPIIDETNG